MARMQVLMNRVEAAWDEHGSLPSRLPPELRERHTELYARAAERAQGRGWNPEMAGTKVTWATEVDVRAVLTTSPDGSGSTTEALRPRP